MWERWRRWVDGTACGVAIATGVAIMVEGFTAWDKLPMLIFAVPFFVGAAGTWRGSNVVKLILALIFWGCGRVIERNNARAEEPLLIMVIGGWFYLGAAAALAVSGIIGLVLEALWNRRNALTWAHRKV